MAFSKHLEKPCHFILGFGVLTIYIPGIFGAAISTGWLFLLIAAPLLLFFYQAKLKDAHIIGLAFLGLASISLLWSANLNIAFFQLLQLIALGIIFYIGSSVKDLKWFFHGLGLGIAINSIIGISQYLGYSTVYTNGNEIAALLVNRNIFCEVSVVLLIAFITFKLWWWIPFTIPGIVLVHSKAALLTLVLAFLAWLWKINKLAVTIIILAIIIVALKQSNYASSIERVDIWLDTIRGLTFFGSGVGSYEILYPKNAIYIDTLIARPKYAHNDFLQAVFEFGVFSLILLTMVINVISIKSNRQIILWSVLVISLFTYPFHVPAMAFIWCLVAGSVVRDNGSDGIARYLWGSDLFKGFKRKQCTLPS